MTTEDGYYGYYSHTDVETLTDDNGDTKATYGYTAYGSNDNSGFTGIDKPDTTDPTKIELDGHQLAPEPSGGGSICGMCLPSVDKLFRPFDLAASVTSANIIPRTTRR
ncbi:hypothetical protein ACFUTY_36615 [Streptomyces sp. NPDC057362]|uniref:hypothetical protein n=1 Tax=Streptomyces sp. NPDC057362 TaxID=3346106 RepID=UPI00362D46E9